MTVRARVSSPQLWMAIVATLAVIGLPAGEAAPSGFEEARKDFLRLKQSSSLLWDAGAIDRYAAFHEAPVLPDLLDAWRAPPAAPRRELRNLLADGILLNARAGRPSDTDFEAASAFARRLHVKPAEAWGAWCGFQALADHPEAEAFLVKCVDAKANPLWRAAAIRTLPKTKGRGWLLKAPIWVEQAKASGKPFERAVLIEALTEACLTASRPWFGPAARRGRELGLKEARHKLFAFAALESLARLFDQGKVPDRTRRLLGEAFDELFGGEGVERDTQAILARLEAEGKPKKREGQTRERRGPRFMSVAGKGRRYLFVIDASDSMLLPLTDAERAALLRLLPKDEDAKADTKTVERRRERMEAAVRTRLDAARLHVAATLKQMERGYSFAILLFGSDAELFHATPGFVPVTKTSVQRVTAALFSLPIGKATSMRPNGTLRGNTNLYRALHKAFRVGPQGLSTTETPETDPLLMFGGPDTIFLLSDGRPTEDGFKGMTPPIERMVQPYSGGSSGPVGRYDPETGRWIGPRPKPNPNPGPAPRPVGKPYKVTTPVLHSTGPFLQVPALAGEIRRMNHIRRASLHVVSIGEAGGGLAMLAEAGGGRFLRVGE